MPTPTTAAAADFYSTSQALKQEILASLDTVPPNVSLATSRFGELRDILRAHLLSGSLPAYDQRSYNQQLRDLETRLSAARTKEKPKSKFAFKPKAPTVPSGEQTRLDLAITATPPVDVAGKLSDTAADSSNRSITASPSSSTLPSSSSSSSSCTFSSLSGRRITLDDLCPSPSASSSESSNATPAKVTDVVLANPDPSRAGPELNGHYVLNLSSLQGCILDFRPPSTDHPSRSLTALHAKNLEQCIILIPPNLDSTRGSLFLSDVRNCILVLSGQQFRMHDSSHCQILLDVSSLPIIENCHHLQFGPFPSSVSTAASSGHSSKATSSPSPTFYDKVQDFSWIRDTPSPNWSTLLLEEQEKLQDSLSDLDGAVVDVLARLIPRR